MVEKEASNWDYAMSLPERKDYFELHRNTLRGTLSHTHIL